ncbi:hypothetical protein E1A91_D04G035000v1 [Gossypium mustelinum]|uniref:RNase H type-1 domain-containing protein n=4 Tax=Gossypium TaxID=3633 RepID=A0A0D2THP8_GOSRA|nr:hypothetical protein B456_012G034200 [Gossypium raimondii]TYG72628.1 hypothetical protein ES288_D04G037000v1 [Gossypium darwinii]TYI85969.1 hypothetical protein E1A91_D04G035000v1 [Gossypium mustelinum]
MNRASGYWWCWPMKCSSSRSTVNKNVIMWKPPPPGWMKFSVAGVIMEDEAGSGGVLRDNKGVAYAMFSRPIEATRLGKAELRAIKIVVEMFMSMGWHEKVHLLTCSSGERLKLVRMVWRNPSKFAPKNTAN